MEAVTQGFLRLLAREGYRSNLSEQQSLVHRLFERGVDAQTPLFRSELQEAGFDFSRPPALTTERLRVLAEWARRGAYTTERALFCVRAPTTAEASEFHDPSRLRPPRVRALADGFRVVREDTEQVVLQTRRGHAVHVSCGGDEIVISCEVYAPGDDSVAQEETYEFARRVAAKLQRDSRAYVFTAAHPTRVSAGVRAEAGERIASPAGGICVACLSEWFQRESHCTRCGLATNTSGLDLRIATALIEELPRERRPQVLELGSLKTKCVIAELLSRMPDDPLLEERLEGCAVRVRNAARDEQHDELLNTIGSHNGDVAFLECSDDARALEATFREDGNAYSDELCVRFEGVIFHDVEHSPGECVEIAQVSVRRATDVELRLRSIELRHRRNAYAFVSGSNRLAAVIVVASGVHVELRK